MNELNAMQRLEEDRRHLLYKLERIGFVPDKDMREALNDIRVELKQRIARIDNELYGD